LNIRRRFNNNGITLIELIVAMAIFGMVIMVVYPMISFTYKTSAVQLRESNQRNQVRVISNYLKNDIEYSKSIEEVGSKLHIVNSSNDDIEYYMESSGSDTYLVRKKGSITKFHDIPDTDFEVLNEHLVGARIYTDVANNKFTDFKIYRFEATIDIPEDEESIYEYIIANKVFVLGNEVEVSGSSTINGNDATVIVKTHLDLHGGNVQYINTKNIYIAGNIDLGGSAGLGKLDGTSNIFITGNTAMSGSANLYGKVVIDGNLTTTTPNLNGNIYVDGNVTFGDGNYDSMSGHIYYTGTLTKPSYIASVNATHVATVEPIVFPTISIPPLQPASWYAAKGYTSNDDPRDNMKFYGGDLDFKDKGNNNFSNVLIASSGDIKLSGNVNVTGILFAPNGVVDINGSSTFRGIIISKETTVSGSSHVTFDAVGINELPF
jgi:prepilin-type N-terminal cleavage/methylation domain-containing protein